MNQLVHLKKPTSSHGSKEAAGETGRTNDPERTKANILAVAAVEFGEKGLAGARIDEIAAATQTSKRMIYYYFGSKEGLYLAVLEESYRRVRGIEAELHLEDLEPEAALRRLVAFTFDHHLKNENYIRLVMSENINRGQYLAQSPRIQDLN
ncbi:MAG TPA: TetR/AcrR family transcriptional regulator, partial [Ramlibacter sp.]|nr:TetR/AcrR family transcriptional regulator [Ramlibacter sp.]